MVPGTCGWAQCSPWRHCWWVRSTNQYHPEAPANAVPSRTEFSGVACRARGWWAQASATVNLCLARRRIGGLAARPLAWCRGAASRRVDCSVVAKGSAARKAHVHCNCRGQYGLCREQSRRSGSAAVWSIAEALPGVAAYEEMHAPHGVARSVGACIA
jgi:hypothetical protein